jgi:glycosyltransferase involved in cell wall biosynthesis
VHVHGDISSSRFYRFLIPLYKKLFYARALRGADAVIALSNIQADFIKKEYGVQRTVVIPNGVGKEYFTKRKDKKSVMKLLFVGRLAEEKNLPRLLQAFKLMKQKAQLHIVGDGEKFQELQDIIRTKRIKNVILHGKKTGTELISIYREADIFVLTSNYEGQPLTMLEAMAAGLPCIGSNVKGITEFLKDDGVLVSPPTPEEFAKHFDKLVHDKQLRMKYGKKSLAKAKRYTWLSTCQQLLKAYHQCRVQSKENHSRTQYKTDGEKDG